VLVATRARDMTAPDPIGRRAFLTRTLKVGVGIGVGSGALGRVSAAAGRTSTGHSSHILKAGMVSSEPVGPSDAVRFVTRPDLAPVGVTVRSSVAHSASTASRKYIFCAPKSPHFASPPGSGVLPHTVFPIGAAPGLMILDTSGELVWFKPMPGPGEIPFNFRVQRYRGRPVLTWFEGEVHEGHGAGHYVLADDTYTAFAHVRSTGYPCDLHEFLVTDDGTALHTAYESHPRFRRPPLLIGHAQEVDIATNELLFDWSSYPEVSPELSYVGNEPTYCDYFHINSIDLWPGGERDLLVSSRNTSAVYLIDRKTSTVRWRLGGKRSDFALGPDARFYFQHDARALADGSGVSLFDDASHPSPETFASGKVLTLDQRSGTATLRRRFIHSDARFVTPSQGNLQLLPDGGHFVGWGYVPFFSAYAPSSEPEPPLVLDGRFPSGAASYRTFLFDWVGNPPVDELRVVARHTIAPGRVRIFVSWNGATEVARWQLNAGADADSLLPHAWFPKDGFETVFDVVAERARDFQVVALDNIGSSLGRSATVALE
jgi:Arylsulfotransferase (ASST)